MSGDATANATTDTNIPRDAQAIVAILKDMGVTDYEPQVVNQLLEFAFRHVSDMMEDSAVYAEHAGRHNINTDDVKLAIQLTTQRAHSGPPPRELVAELARERNAMDIAPSGSSKRSDAVGDGEGVESGLVLPHDRHCLLQPNFRLRSNKQVLVATQRFNPNAPRGGLPQPGFRQQQPRPFRQPQPVVPAMPSPRGYRPLRPGESVTSYAAASSGAVQSVAPVKQEPIRPSAPGAGAGRSSLFRIVPGTGTKRKAEDLDEDYDND